MKRTRVYSKKMLFNNNMIMDLSWLRSANRHYHSEIQIPYLVAITMIGAFSFEITAIVHHWSDSEPIGPFA